MVTSSKSQPFKGERSEPGILDSAPTLQALGANSQRNLFEITLP